MIEDADLRLMFKAESEERLQNLEQQLLQLEKQPDGTACLEVLFREAHSLKGLARMLNLKNMEQVAHHFESVLKAAKNQGHTLAPKVAERLYHGVDSLRGLANEAVTGAEYPRPVEPILFELEHGAVEPAQAKVEPAPMPEIAPLQAPESTLPHELPVSSVAKLDTIRIGAQQLDSLLTLASELTVNKNRLAQRFADIKDILFLWDEWKLQPKPLIRPVNLADVEARLRRLREQLQEDNNRIEYLNNEISTSIRAIRLLPLSTTFAPFPRMVRDIAKQQGKQIDFIVEGENTVADKRVIEEITDPLMHLLRNAVDHAIETPDLRQSLGKPAHGTLRLIARQTATNIIISLHDDGAGIDPEEIRRQAEQKRMYDSDELAQMTDRQVLELIFAQGFSTSSDVNTISGRGLGMAIVRNKIEQLKGHIDIDSVVGQGTTFQIVLPISLATTKVIVIGLNRRYFAVPMNAIEHIRSITTEQLFSIDGQRAVLHQNQAVSVASLTDLLELPPLHQAPAQWLAIIIAVKQGRIALLVEELLEEQEVLLKPLGGVLKRVRNISGVTVLGNGEICLILNPQDLVRTAQGKKAHLPAKTEAAVSKGLPPKILYAEDSITTRTQIKRVLEKAGYQVTAAVDGRDAYEKLGSGQFAAVVSDVTMPNMDGLALTEKIRSQSRFQQLPIILLSAMDKSGDRHLALELGATAYLSKKAFDHTLLLETLKTFI